MARSPRRPVQRRRRSGAGAEIRSMRCTRQAVMRRLLLLTGVLATSGCGATATGIRQMADQPDTYTLTERVPTKEEDRAAPAAMADAFCRARQRRMLPLEARPG